jgi:GT2 family glycosyltransferase
MTTRSVIVVSYKPGEWLEPCLRSVADQTDEIIVVDNGSEDARATTIARLAGASSVRCDRNIGFAAGFNRGLHVTQGDIIGLLNDDAVAGPNWLSAAADALSQPRVAAVTPKVLLTERFAEILPDAGFPSEIHSLSFGEEDVLTRAVGPGLHPVDHRSERPECSGSRQVVAGRPFYVPVGDQSHEIRIDGLEITPRAVVRLLNHAGSFLRNHGIAGEYGFAAPDDGRFDLRAERFGFSGTAPVFAGDILRSVGGFADAFFAYNEDTDWCLRARLAGYRIMYDPVATVEHRLSASSGGPWNAFVRFLAERNALLCLLRNAPVAVVRECVLPRLRFGPKDQVRRSVLRRLPWALASRAMMAPKRRHSPAEVWEQWAERETSWDDSPAHLD